MLRNLSISISNPPRNTSGGGGYIGKVLGYIPILYMVNNEVAGTTSVDQVNSPAQDGTYTNIVLNSVLGPDGVNNAPSWNGTTAYNDFYSATFAPVFDGNEGSISVFAKVNNAGNWNEGRDIVIIRNNANNQIRLARQGALNTLFYSHRGSGVFKDLSYVTAGSTAWIHIGFTWSLSTGASGEAKAYLNGSQVGATMTGLGSYAVAPISSRVLQGANSTASLFWHGNLAQMAIFDYALSAPQMLDIATV